MLVARRDVVRNTRIRINDQLFPALSDAVDRGELSAVCDCLRDAWRAAVVTGARDRKSVLELSSALLGPASTRSDKKTQRDVIDRILERDERRSGRELVLMPGNLQ